MTLRDEIAITAMAAIIAKTPARESPVDDGSITEYMTARGAYSYADAMLEVRKEKGGSL